MKFLASCKMSNNTLVIVMLSYNLACGGSQPGQVASMAIARLYLFVMITTIPRVLINVMLLLQIRDMLSVIENGRLDGRWSCSIYIMPKAIGDILTISI